MVSVWGLFSGEMWLPMVFVLCCDSGFYRFTLACYVISRLDKWWWLTPRTFGLRLNLLAYASSFWLVPHSFGLCLIPLACASFLWLAPRSFGLCFVHWLGPRSAGFLLVLLSLRHYNVCVAFSLVMCHVLVPYIVPIIFLGHLTTMLGMGLLGVCKGSKGRGHWGVGGLASTWTVLVGS